MNSSGASEQEKGFRDSRLTILKELKCHIKYIFLHEAIKGLGIEVKGHISCTSMLIKAMR